MQTYLPLPELEGSFLCLDDLTLRQQCLDAVRLLDCLVGYDPCWTRHPAFRMWYGFEQMLCCYAHMAHDFHLRRLTTHSQLFSWFMLQETVRRRPDLMGTPAVPPWWNDRRLHTSHQSNLVRKNPAHYGPIFPKTKPSPVWCWPWVEKRAGTFVVHVSITCEEP